MGKRVELPRLPAGTEKEQLQTLYSYLYQMAETLNNNLAEIGGAELTDSERVIVNGIIGDGTAEAMNEAESLKSLIIKTAEFVQSQLNEYRMHLLGEYVAEGKFGKYVRKTGLDVDVTPTGITQNYTFQEIIQDLKRYEVNAKNYIKTGLLRTVSSVPVYGVAIGKDVVTFSQDGTETYNDGNKVAELTADELSFWQNSVKIASYTGSKITFYYNGGEALYIQNGKIYCKGDLEITSGKTLKIVSGGVMDVDTANFKISSANKKLQAGNWKLDDTGIEYVSNNSTEAFCIRQGIAWGDETTGIYHTLGDVAGSTAKIGTLNFAIRFFDGSTHRTSHLYNRGMYTNSKKRITTAPGDADQWYVGNSSVYTYITTDDITAYNYYNRSSRDIKHDIRNMEEQGEKLDLLRPVTFIYDNDAEERRRNGLIYEEAMEIMPEICTRDESDKAINYTDLIPVLLKEIQELRARVKALEEREGGN